MNHDYTIRSSEIVLTPIGEDDIELMRDWRNAPINQTSFLTNSYIEAEQQRLWYQKYLGKEDDIMFIINDITGATTKIGMVGLYDVNTELGTAEFGRFLIGEPSARGKGLGFTVTLLLCKFGFEQLKLNEIRLEVLGENSIAHTIYSKVGFLPQGQYYKDGKEVLRMSLFKEQLKCV
ncbi:GNAT family protein [Paenibacillus sp. FSL F4-0125]|uniref:GNAT family N-acetyltransferase n=1 Tax=Paenibacillus sp. FSL F4-0125 TaxID=2954730 RepID=UPI0030F89611